MTRREQRIIRAINWIGCGSEDWGILPQSSTRERAAIYVSLWVANRIKSQCCIDADCYMTNGALYYCKKEKEGEL